MRSSREDRNRRLERIKAQIVDRKRRERWEKSEEANRENAIAIFIVHTIVIVFGTFLISISAYMVLNGSTGAVLPVLLVFGPIYLYILKYASPLSLTAFLQSFPVIFKDKKLSLIVLTCINIALFLVFGFRTLIPITLLPVLYLLPVLLVYLALKKQNTHAPLFYALGLGPLLVNTLLALNFFISFNPVKEQYHYGLSTQTVYTEHPYSSSTQNSTLVVLENNVYSAFPGLRIFNDYEQLRLHNTVRYTFKTGCFGLRVLSGCELVYTN